MEKNIWGESFRKKTIARSSGKKYMPSRSVRLSELKVKIVAALFPAKEDQEYPCLIISLDYSPAYTKLGYINTPDDYIKFCGIVFKYDYATHEIIVFTSSTDYCQFDNL